MGLPKSALLFKINDNVRVVRGQSFLILLTLHPVFSRLRSLNSAQNANVSPTTGPLNSCFKPIVVADSARVSVSRSTSSLNQS
ncbi:hypothetical protein CPBF426_10280 [Xanthomonas arboricola pv. juglandis]|nr:hypothetical protein CPBF426_10280 [Xanthomonas arboricola pv. juglandis]